MGLMSLDVVGSKVCLGVVDFVELARVVALTIVVVVVLAVLVESCNLAASFIFSATVSKKLGLGVAVWQPLPAKTFNCPGPKTTS